MRQYERWILLGLLALIWGSSFILIKKGLVSYGFIEAATLRMVAAGSVFAISAVFHLPKIPRQSWIYVVMASIFGMFLPAYLFCIAQQHVQSVVAGLLNALTPAFAFVFSIFMFHSRYQWVQVSGLILGLMSAIILAFERANGSVSFNAYALLIVLATVSYGFNINLVKKKLQNVPAMSLSYVSVFFAGLLATVFFLIPRWGDFHFDEGHKASLTALVVLGVMGTAVAQVIYYRLIKISTPLFTSSVTFLIPVVALIWGILNGEVLHLVHLLCIGGILASVAIIRKS